MVLAVVSAALALGAEAALAGGSKAVAPVSSIGDGIRGAGDGVPDAADEVAGAGAAEQQAGDAEGERRSPTSSTVGTSQLRSVWRNDGVGAAAVGSGAPGGLGRRAGSAGARGDGAWR